MIFQFAGDFFSGSTHHSYHPTLYTVEPELELVLQNINFLVDFFVVTNQANYQDYSGIYN